MSHYIHIVLSTFVLQLICITVNAFYFVYCNLYTGREVSYDDIFAITVFDVTIAWTVAMAVCLWLGIKTLLILHGQYQYLISIHPSPSRKVPFYFIFQFGPFSHCFQQEFHIRTAVEWNMIYCSSKHCHVAGICLYNCIVEKIWLIFCVSAFGITSVNC